MSAHSAAADVAVLVLECIHMLPGIIVPLHKGERLRDSLFK